MTETRVGHYGHDDIDVYAGRGDGGRNVLDTEPGERGWLGNPFVTEDNAKQTHRERPSVTIVSDRFTAVVRFREVFEERLDDEEFQAAVSELAGQTLGCWCQRLECDRPRCHAQVIAEHADRLTTTEVAADD